MSTTLHNVNRSDRIELLALLNGTTLVLQIGPNFNNKSKPLKFQAKKKTDLTNRKCRCRKTPTKLSLTIHAEKKEIINIKTKIKYNFVFK